MKDEINEFLKDHFGIEDRTTIEFREFFGFTFAIEKSVYIFQGRYTSAEIKPVAIIYEENGEFYLAPLDKTTKIDTIVKEFVENCLK